MNAVHRLLICLFLLGSAAPNGFGQPHAKLRFDQDSVALGEVVRLSLEVTHQESMKVYFPTRRQDFLPFEFVRNERPTQEQRGDSLVETIVYWVRTFDLAPQQVVRLPYSYLTTRDTTTADIESDTVYLAERIPDLQDSLKYKLELDAYELGEEESYREWILGGLVVIVVLGLLAWLLRRPVQLLLQRRALRQEWQQVKRQMQRLDRETDQEALFDQLSHHWKHWMDPEETYGLPSMTTTELETRLPQLKHLSPGHRAVLLQASRDADRAIYAGQQLDRGVITQLIQSLLDVMQKEYKRRDKQVRGRKESN